MMAKAQVNIEIRKPRIDECSQVLTLMQDLADFEGYFDAFNVTQASLEQHYYEEQEFNILVAAMDNQLQGILVYYFLPFTYDLTPWLFMKELYVKPEKRGLGLGKQLMKAAAKECQDKGGSRMNWQVLTDNHRAQDFYRQLGATHDPLWQNFSLSKPAIERLLKEQADD